MTQVITFTGYTPPARYDTVAWTDAQIEEGTTSAGAWGTIDTLTLGTVDPDPAFPAARSFTTSQGTAPDLWYRVVYLDGSAGSSDPTIPFQNGGTTQPYATPTELARILKIRAPSDAQTAAMERVLISAAGEIDAEVGRVDDPLTGWQAQLAAEVNLERAVEHWNQQESPFGVVGLGDAGAVFTARDSWDRHAHKLAPLKESWGMA